MTTTADHSLHAPSDTFGSSPRTAAHASSAAPTVALGRLVAVEARKLVDTRAGRWLLIATFALATLTTALLAYGSAEFAPGKPLLASELANTAIEMCIRDSLRASHQVSTVPLAVTTMPGMW